MSNYPNYPIFGFVAGTKVMTPNGPVPIEQLRPGDMIETLPANDRGDDKSEAQYKEPGWWEKN